MWSRSPQEQSKSKDKHRRTSRDKTRGDAKKESVVIGSPTIAGDLARQAATALKDLVTLGEGAAGEMVKRGQHVADLTKMVAVVRAAIRVRRTEGLEDAELLSMAPPGVVLSDLDGTHEAFEFSRSALIDIREGVGDLLRENTRMTRQLTKAYADIVRLRDILSPKPITEAGRSFTADDIRGWVQELEIEEVDEDGE
jgi:hypothetical protein